MHCPKCGVLNDDAARFCQSCGSNIVQASPPQHQQAYAPYAAGPQQQAYAPHAPPPAYAPPPPVWGQPGGNGYGPPPQAVPLMRGQSALMAQPNMALAHPAQGTSNPVLMALLSFFVPGLGQLCQHDFKKGVVMFGIAVIGGAMTIGLVWLVVAVWSAIDAHQVAKGIARAW